MSTYIVHVIIENKPNISDPEGDTILNDLAIKYLLNQKQLLNKLKETLS